mgnify:CR=1 FL=1
MPVSMPTMAQVDDLPVLMEKVVPPEWQDLNGHVNVRHYLELYDAASWPMLAALGVDERLFLEQRQGLFDLEHHLWYLDELHVGDTLMDAARPLAAPLPGYKEAKPVVFAGIFPVNPADYPDLAAALARLIQTEQYGIYHLTNAGYCSRHEFAVEIMKQGGRAHVPVLPVFRTAQEWQTYAERLRAELNPRYGNAHVVEFDRGDRVFYRVRVGRCSSLDEATAMEAQLMRSGFPDAFAVAE